MKRFCCLILAVLCLTGCGRFQAAPVAETFGLPIPQAAETTVPPETTQPVETTVPPETTQATEPPQVYVEVFREGQSSQIPVEMVQGTVGNYTMAMDPEYFVFHPQETADVFSYDAWEDLPAVYYAVSDYRDNATPQEFIDGMLVQYRSFFDDYTTEETTIGNYPATAIYFSGFITDSTRQYHIFCVNCQGNYYILEASFTFEMYEGLYAIMRACFETMTPTE